MTRTVTTTVIAATRQDLKLSGIELLACWEALRLGPPPTLLPLFSPAHNHHQRAGKRARAIAGLTQRGLADGPLPHPTLADALRLLARPDHWLDLRCADGPHRMRFALGAIAQRVLGTADEVGVSGGEDRVVLQRAEHRARRPGAAAGGCGR